MIKNNCIVCSNLIVYITLLRLAQSGEKFKKNTRLGLVGFLKHYLKLIKLNQFEDII